VTRLVCPVPACSLDREAPLALIERGYLERAREVLVKAGEGDFA
jgi:hypothetical protein